MSPSSVSCSIDLHAPGKRIGHLRINKITNTAGWASTFIHIGCVVNGDGPTVLVLGGNHGDEYEGQVAGMRLLTTDVAGFLPLRGTSWLDVDVLDPKSGILVP